MLRHGWVYKTGRVRWTQCAFSVVGCTALRSAGAAGGVSGVSGRAHRGAGARRGAGRCARRCVTWWLRPVVEALTSLRGVKLITAMIVLAGLGDVTHCDSPRQMMSFLGLVPSDIPRASAAATVRSPKTPATGVCAGCWWRRHRTIATRTQDRASATQGCTRAQGGLGAGLGGAKTDLHPLPASQLRRHG